MFFLTETPRLFPHRQPDSPQNLGEFQEKNWFLTGIKAFLLLSNSTCYAIINQRLVHTDIRLIAQVRKTEQLCSSKGGILVSYRDCYEQWLANPELEEELHQELTNLSESDIREAFYAPLAFGTAGLRGIMGAGIGRMNVYTVRQATQGVADCVLAENGQNKGVAISYDCRNNSRRFAQEAAKVLAANGIQVYLFEAMRPTPELSFALLHYGCIAGINITASHNPKEYNGYKVYWSDGAQIDNTVANRVSAAISACDIFIGAKTMDFEKACQDGLIRFLGNETDELFLSACLSCRVRPEVMEGSNVRMVYTPFHGTGYQLVPEVLKRAGLHQVFCVPEQMVPSGDFPTVKSPNPEEKEGFTLAIALAKEKGADLIIGTDPDSDRLGVIVRAGEEYVNLSGNQVGVLLTDYLIRARKESGTLPDNSAIFSTVVTSLMARRVCEANDITYVESFTGFRFIAEQQQIWRRKGYVPLMGFEESYGYMVGPHCKDKDAVTAALLVAEIAAYYDKQGKNLYQVMQDLYARYGFFAEHTKNIYFPGVDGLQTMKDLMTSLRTQLPRELGGIAVTALRDYADGTRHVNETVEALDLSGSNVLYFELANGCSLVIRPSGTEPKIKVYLLAKGENEAQCKANLEQLHLASEALTK